MTSAATAVTLRDHQGRYPPGTSGNPEGVNQYSLNATLPKRIALAIEAELERRPECVTSFAKDFASALKRPRVKNNLDFLSRLCRELIIGTQGPVGEPQPLPSGEAEARSEAHWIQLADEFGTRHAEHPGVVIETQPIRSEGAD